MATTTKAQDRAMIHLHTTVGLGGSTKLVGSGALVVRLADESIAVIDRNGRITTP